jgi:hypothetical protein
MDDRWCDHLIRISTVWWWLTSVLIVALSAQTVLNPGDRGDRGVDDDA